jgi:peptidylprolyl isomerase
VLLGLAGCGNGSSSASSSADPLDAVSISGDVGSKPTVTWNSDLKTDTVATTTLTKGDGDTVQKGDAVITQIWIGNGFSQKQAYSTYDSGGASPITVDDNLSPVIENAVEGATVGSRIVVTTPADKLFGPQGNPQLNIGNKDPLLVIIDLISKPAPPLQGPKGKTQPSPAWAPTVVQKGGTVTSLGFAKTPKPDGKLRAAALIKGTGAVVKKGQTITVDYLGQVYGASKPFDESYSKEPATFGIGTGQVISGWDKTIVGQRVGSRLILAIPPDEGYGKQGQPSAGIKGTDTLYFVVDILAAS